ncbi:MAG: hypothetical protein FJ333_08225, partial [Sphingomonadales bacterium]|nr:hypothetical protein [Sphingomonadales bacterium]
MLSYNSTKPDFSTKPDLKILKSSLKCLTIPPQMSDRKFPKVEVKFDRDTYDRKQFSAKKDELYCPDCDVHTNTRDQMQCHKLGQNHKKMSSRVVEYRCDLCLVTVPCQDTLDNHKKGKDHLKRVLQLEEKTKGSAEAAESDLSRSSVAEQEVLRLRVRFLQNQVTTLMEKEKACQRDHQDARQLETEVASLRKMEEHYKWDLDQMQQQLASLQQQLTRSEESSARLEQENIRLKARLAAASSSSLRKTEQATTEEYAERPQSLERGAKVDRDSNKMKAEYPYTGIEMPCSSQPVLPEKREKEEIDIEESEEYAEVPNGSDSGS